MSSVVLGRLRFGVLIGLLVAVLVVAGPGCAKRVVPLGGDTEAPPPVPMTGIEAVFYQQAYSTTYTATFHNPQGLRIVYFWTGPD